MFKKYADALWGVVILIVCALMFYATTQIRVFAAMEGLSSRFFPVSSSRLWLFWDCS